jgi:hypothetical protein
VLQAKLVVVLQVELAMQVAVQLAELAMQVVALQVELAAEQVELAAAELVVDRSNSIVG